MDLQGLEGHTTKKKINIGLSWTHRYHLLIKQGIG
jgi:hypothetical protein